jgi:hypothetical protein
VMAADTEDAGDSIHGCTIVSGVPSNPFAYRPIVSVLLAKLSTCPSLIAPCSEETGK